MKIRSVLPSIAFLLLVATPVSAQGDFVYTNNDLRPSRLNTLSGFATEKSGALTQLPGSPYLTGGRGGGGGFIASNRAVRVGEFLYASNTITSDVSAFFIDSETGALVPIPGSPFPTGGSSGSGFSLAATPDGRFLYAAQAGSATIRIFAINIEDGSLSAVGDLIPLGAERSANGMKVSPDGKWLAVVLTRVPPHGAVAMFSIDPKTGELTAVEGSPFPVPGSGGPNERAAGVDINCTSEFLFVGVGSFGTTIVHVFRIDADTGALTPIERSPFMPGVGINSNVVLLSPDDSFLFVSNQGNGTPGSHNTVTVFYVASDGRLKVIPGSPFPAPGGQSAAGMATDRAGRLLYVTMAEPYPTPVGVYVFSVSSEGELTPVEGSPFPTFEDLDSALFSVTAYPGKSCPKKPKLEAGR